MAYRYVKYPLLMPTVAGLHLEKKFKGQGKLKKIWGWGRGRSVY